jgi:hypothetical protein
MAEYGSQDAARNVEQIITKVVTERYTRVGLSNWTEPFLNLPLQDYVAVVRKAGLSCEISTTLSLRHVDNLEETVLAGLNWMTVSISGATQATSEINHVDGNIHQALVNLDGIREIIDRHSLQTVINVRFIRFDYNAGEVNELRRYAERMRYTFEVIEGNSHPKSDLVRKSITEANLKKAVRRGNANRTLERRDEVCALIFDRLVIDCVGDIYPGCSFIESAALKQLAAPVWSV